MSRVWNFQTGPVPRGTILARIIIFMHTIQMFRAHLKRHSQLCDCANLNTSFSQFEKSLPQPKIIVHLDICFIFPSVLLDFQSLTEKPVLECPFAHPMRIFLSYLVQKNIYRVSGICKLAMEWHVRRMCTSWLCPFKSSYKAFKLFPY